MPPEIATHEDLERKLAWLEHLISDSVGVKGHKVGGPFATADELKVGLGVMTRLDPRTPRE
jgi:hypothetical protein